MDFGEKGGTARCLFLLKPDWKVCATCVVFVTITRSSYLWHKHHHGINLFIIRTVLHCFPAESNIIPFSNVFTNMRSSGSANLDKRIYENLIVNLLVLHLLIRAKFWRYFFQRKCYQKSEWTQIVTTLQSFYINIH